MSRQRIVALVRRVVLEIRRDRPSLAILFVAPILITGLVTFILREGQTPTVTAVVVNEAGPPGAIVATALDAALRQAGGSAVAATDEAAARAAIEDGSATVAVILPADLRTASPPTIRIITKGLDPAADGNQLGALSRALASTAATLAVGLIPVIDHRTLYGVPSGDPITNFAPAIVGFFAYFFVYVLTGVCFLRERTVGTLERLMATPVTRGEIVIGYTVGFGLFATLQVALLIVWVLASVHVPALGPLPAFSVGLGVGMVGSPVLAFLVVLLLAVGAGSLGIFLSTFARTELQIIQFIPIVLAPQFLLSGVLFPVSTLPPVVQPLVQIMPLSYAVDGLRQVFIRGADLGVGALQLDLIVLAAVAVLFATVASLTIRRDVV